MKGFVTFALVGLLSVSYTLARGGNPGGADCGGNPATPAELPYEAIDDVERADLVFMIEEEKLARDVYRALDDLWGLRAFRNIAGAEQSHMNAVATLLDKYDIENPVVGAPRGAFDDPALQQLHDELLEQGSASLIDALIVGATIEDLDIQDLEVRLERTDNEDVRTVFQNLQKGSRNHLRAFAGLLEQSGMPYEPQYISIDAFELVVGSPVERGRVDADGEPVNCGGRAGRHQRHRHGGRNE